MSRAHGEEWVEGPDGTRYWGRFGAAGLLVVDPERRILLQHRALWSHFGGTWGLPGGARHEAENSVDAALREAHEEAGVPGSTLEILFESVFDLGFWSYTTVAARAPQGFAPVISDPESLALDWVGLDDVTTHELHPGLAGSWPMLRERLRDEAGIG